MICILNKSCFLCTPIKFRVPEIPQEHIFSKAVFVKQNLKKNKGNGMPIELRHLFRKGHKIFHQIF